MGDDEQFATGRSRSSRTQLGFPSRVVVGVRLQPEADAAPACPDGGCRGRDVTAWIEVQSVEGDWVPVDVTPQHTDPIDSEARRQRDPENVTEVRPETAEEVVAPGAGAARHRVGRPAGGRAAGSLRAWGTLRVVGIVALVLAVALGPFLVVVAAKAMRRRGRRSRPGSVDRVVGDGTSTSIPPSTTGFPPPAAETRTELAARYATPSAVALADTADRTVFSLRPRGRRGSPVLGGLSTRSGDASAHDASMWCWLVAAVSLKSFVRFVTPSPVRGRVPSA